MGFSYESQRVVSDGQGVTQFLHFATDKEKKYIF
jgi:predicted ester cyclase